MKVKTTVEIGVKYTNLDVEIERAQGLWTAKVSHVVSDEQGIDTCETLISSSVDLDDALVAVQDQADQWRMPTEHVAQALREAAAKVRKAEPAAKV